MFIVKIFVSNKYQKMTLRHEKLPVHLMLASDAQGAQQLARQFLHVGAPFCAQYSPCVPSLSCLPGGIRFIEKATLTL